MTRPMYDSDEHPDNQVLGLHHREGLEVFGESMSRARSSGHHVIVSGDLD